jgi:hypothetical protein
MNVGRLQLQLWHSCLRNHQPMRQLLLLSADTGVSAEGVRAYTCMLARI